MSKTAFFDEAKIYVQAGAGGDGSIAFRREKYVPHGGPAGGNGGRGGNVYLRVSPHLNTLVSFRRRRHFRAERGKHGSGSTKHGRSGTDLYVDVPPGTVVRVAEKGEFLADLMTPGYTVCVAKGGRGDGVTPVLPPPPTRHRASPSGGSLARSAGWPWN